MAENHGPARVSVCQPTLLTNVWWFSAALPFSVRGRPTESSLFPPMHFSLKTKITTPLVQESIDYYQQVFGMQILEEWDEPIDRGAILAFADSREEALLEIYYDENTHDFSGLGLQFRADNLARFIDQLPPGIEYDGPKPRPWGSTYLYLKDPNGILVVVYEGGN